MSVLFDSTRAMYVSIMSIGITSLYFWALFGTTRCILSPVRSTNECRRDQINENIVGTVRFVGQSPNPGDCFPRALERRATNSPTCIPYIVRNLRNEGVTTTCNHNRAQLTSEVVECSYNRGEYICEVDMTDRWIFIIDLKLSTSEADICIYTNLWGEQRQGRTGQTLATLTSGRLVTQEEAPFSVGIRCGASGCGVLNIHLLVVKYRCL